MTPVDNQIELDGKSPEELDALLKDALAEKPDETVIPEKEETIEPDPTDAAKESADLKATVARLEKQVRDKEAFIIQRNAELGILRKQAKGVRPDPELTVKNDDFMADPVGATKKAFREMQKHDTEEDEDFEKSQSELRDATHAAVHQWEPEYEKATPELAELMKQDGAPDEVLAQFKKDPVHTFAPPVVFQLVKRLKAERRVKELEAKLAASEKKPAAIARNIQNAGKSKPAVSSAPASSKAPKGLEDITEDDINNMSPEELDKAYKTFTKGK